MKTPIEPGTAENPAGIPLVPPATREASIPVIRAIELKAYQYRPAEGAIYGNSKSMGNFPTRSSVVQIETTDGIVGFGEAGGSPAILREQLALVSSEFLGRSLFDFDVIRSAILNRHYHSGVQNEIVGLLGGIDVAILDAIGKTFGVRVCDLIGGCRRSRIPVYASTGYFSDDPQNTFEDMLRGVAGSGFLGAKIKIGRGIRSDVERVATAREILGSDILLIADINAAYTQGTALQAITELARFNLHWIEEPLPPREWRSYAELRARSPVPLSAGEALYTSSEFNTLISERCVDIVQPSIASTGGLRESKSIAFLAELANLRVAPHVWGSGLAVAVGVHFCATLPDYPNPDYPAWPTLLEFDTGIENPLRDKMLKVPVRLSESHVDLPSGSGLGVDIDWDAIDQFRIF